MKTTDRRTGVSRAATGYRGGFTLVELMIGLALSLIIMGVVTYGFFVTSQATKRGLGTNDLHEQASTAYAIMSRDFANRIPGSPWRYQGNTFTLLTLESNADPDKDGRPDTDRVVEVTYTFEFDPPSGHGALDSSGNSTNTGGAKAFFAYNSFSLTRKAGDEQAVVLSYKADSGSSIYLPVPPPGESAEYGTSNVDTDDRNFGALALCNVYGGRIRLQVKDVDNPGNLADDPKALSVNFLGRDELGQPRYAFYYRSTGTGAKDNYFVSSVAAPRGTNAKAPQQCLVFDYSDVNIGAPAYLRVHLPFIWTGDGTALTDTVRRVALDNAATLEDGALETGPNLIPRRSFVWFFKL